ncbi:hypothetical protein GUJ93_ZPchr0013g37864 [Zizania palustris]|uniref:Uncharacterized protein n=1 Tax=Zizania palustris TaxID=103762 RepID=A0A8J6BYD9_ZIZPA|nr:hypothetical protein GUJ93_ZPchr0013g37864 [Zizania palustris]
MQFFSVSSLLTDKSETTIQHEIIVTGYVDRSLASLGPQKTTVKRLAQQQCHKISSDLPFRSNKKIFDSQMAAISKEKSSGSPTIHVKYCMRNKAVGIPAQHIV